ncbi:MAG: hypothetical protein Q4G68_11010 [Planctomycetia bacterium]|nr:hypothetical protein [Planctomycetia bacterium]
MKKIIFVIIFAIALALVVSTLCLGEDQLRSPSELTYIRYVEENNKHRISVQNAKVWIEKLEEALDGAKDDKVYYSIICSLADLHDLVNEKSVSEKLYLQAFNSTEVPCEFRIMAGENYLSRALQNEKMSPDLLNFFKSFEEFIEALPHDSRINYLPKLHINRVMYIDSLIKKSEKMCNSINVNEESDSVFDIMLNAYTTAIDIISKSISEYALLTQEQKDYLKNMDFGEDSMFYYRGKIRFDLGMLYKNNNRIAEGQSQFGAAVEDLSDALEKYGRTSNFAAKSFILLLKAEEASGKTDNVQFIQCIKRVLPFIKNMNNNMHYHEIHNYLLDKAMILSKDGTRDLAAYIFTVVIEQEKQYFPKEYGNHLNYQLALAATASNYSEIGDSKQMQKSLDELKSCRPLDSGTEKLITQYIENANARMDFTQMNYNANSGLKKVWPRVVFIIMFNIIGFALIVFLLRGKKVTRTGIDGQSSTHYNGLKQETER